MDRTIEMLEEKLAQAEVKIAEQEESLRWYARIITEREEYKCRAEAAEKELKRIKGAIIDSVMNAITSGRWLENDNQ